MARIKEIPGIFERGRKLVKIKFERKDPLLELKIDILDKATEQIFKEENDIHLILEVDEIKIIDCLLRYDEINDINKLNLLLGLIIPQQIMI